MADLRQPAPFGSWPGGAGEVSILMANTPSPDPELVEQFRQSLAALAPDLRGGYALGYLAATIREAVEHHTAICGGCSTCEQLGRMFALTFAYELSEAPPDVLRRIHGLDDLM